ncbi:MAG: hypothetical protein KA451_12980 [Methyloversatilis sp.]|nr:hypothetical protein [Methyloversatilis sp.]MBP6195300.1 hypothetical protein [Methyloversatilis sp.]
MSARIDRPGVVDRCVRQPDSVRTTGDHWLAGGIVRITMKRVSGTHCERDLSAHLAEPISENPGVQCGGCGPDGTFSTLPENEALREERDGVCGCAGYTSFAHSVVHRSCG